MSGETATNVKALPRDKFRILAEANDWSPEYARGYVDGEACRQRGKALSKYVLVGIDEYCLGFRAGYYERRDRESATNLSAPPAAHR